MRRLRSWTTFIRFTPALLAWLMVVPLMADSIEEAPIAFAIHGGAGTILREEMSAEKEAAIRAKLDEAVSAGYQVLADGGRALDAVTAAIVILEDSPLFNAGKGAVFNAQGENELDASIMDGATLEAGAVAGVRTVKNPILLAEKVMTDSVHVMLATEGAEEFARSVEVERVEPGYFHTDFRWEQLQKIKREESLSGVFRDSWFSTVGAVALDREGNLAAGTSTGGMANKRWGRVGDSPIIGAGTYADNRSCAVSATGHGEYFIRHAVAHDICARMRHGGDSLEQAAESVINGELSPEAGSGGVIAVDHAGNISLVFNTPGMYRASIDANASKDIAIYRP